MDAVDFIKEDNELEVGEWIDDLKKKGAIEELQTQIENLSFLINSARVMISANSSNNTVVREQSRYIRYYLDLINELSGEIKEIDR